MRNVAHKRRPIYRNVASDAPNRILARSRGMSKMPKMAQKRLEIIINMATEMRPMTDAEKLALQHTVTQSTAEQLTHMRLLFLMANSQDALTIIDTEARERGLIT